MNNLKKDSENNSSTPLEPIIHQDIVSNFDYINVFRVGISGPI
jgi:hypothetical protein